MLQPAPSRTILSPSSTSPISVLQPILSSIASQFVPRDSGSVTYLLVILSLGTIVSSELLPRDASHTQRAQPSDTTRRLRTSDVTSNEEAWNHEQHQEAELDRRNSRRAAMLGCTRSRGAASRVVVSSSNDTEARPRPSHQQLPSSWPQTLESRLHCACSVSTNGSGSRASTALNTLSALATRK
ncbi:hypothetical protein K490DRAFT_56439 [Saccharata proteae CBS 121410]|uniref:Uncharacterized protein n=1 Tax=Saccharata proteae CBS 121410 TaxID=1314787 RepID=A0A9P4HW49_9PEZI|nr:hypothetical protein K490DRAFT_56439 [Saccharata proteae CBS 121410]